MKQNFFSRFQDSIVRYTDNEKTGTYIAVVLSHLLSIDMKFRHELFKAIKIIPLDTDMFRANKYYKKSGKKWRETDIKVEELSGRLRLLIEIKFDDCFQKDQLKDYLKQKCPILLITKNPLTESERKLIEKFPNAKHLHFYKLLKIAESSKNELTMQFCDYLKETGVTMFHSKISCSDVEFYMSRILANRSKNGRRSGARFKNPGKFLSQVGDNMSLVGENLNHRSGIQGSPWFFQDFLTSVKKKSIPILREKLLVDDKLVFYKDEFDKNEAKNRAFSCFVYNVNGAELEVGYVAKRDKKKVMLCRYVYIQRGDVYIEEEIKIRERFFQLSASADDEAKAFFKLLGLFEKKWFSKKVSWETFLRRSKEGRESEYKEHARPISSRRKKVILEIKKKVPNWEKLLGKKIDEHFYTIDKAAEKKYLIKAWEDYTNSLYWQYWKSYSANKKLIIKMLKQ